MTEVIGKYCTEKCSGEEKKAALLVPQAYDESEAIKILLALHSDQEIDEIIIQEPDFSLNQLGCCDTLVIPSFDDLGFSDIDLWPIILSLHHQGTTVVALDIGFDSSMPDGDLVMNTIGQAVNSQRKYFLNQKQIVQN